MNRFLAAVACLLAVAGCAEKKQIRLPMRQPARVQIPGAVRTLLFESVTESHGNVPGGYRVDSDNNVELVKAMLSSEFCASTFAVLNDDLIDMVRKAGSVPRYLSDGPTVAADFLGQMIGDPGSIGVVEVQVSSAFGDSFTVQNREIHLTTTHAGGRPTVQKRTIPVHRVDVFGAVTATVRIRTPYPDGKVVFERTYIVPEFRFSSAESAPKDLWFFSRNDASRSGSGAPTVTEVKAIQFKKLARMFYEDISPGVREEAALLDKRGDRMAYNLLAEGALPWAEMRLRKLGSTGKPEEVAANTYNLGLCWEAQGLVAEAGTKYKAALDLEPGNGLFQKAYHRAGGAAK
ncbi:MAG: hypothetical protein HUU15_02145 [Candidatus Brocadiae bacterium]|nr:hypothetical protein [Candidatus Brocadiia bacterium]